jgi:excisionase family DNA binding protein
MSFEPEPVVDAETVAAYLGVTRMSVYRWINQLGLPSHKLGRNRRFKLSEIDAWIKSRCTYTAPDQVVS